jgi:hypothetical protein
MPRVHVSDLNIVVDDIHLDHIAKFFDKFSREFRPETEPFHAASANVDNQRQPDALLSSLAWHVHVASASSMASSPVNRSFAASALADKVDNDILPASTGWDFNKVGLGHCRAASSFAPLPTSRRLCRLRSLACALNLQGNLLGKLLYVTFVEQVRRELGNQRARRVNAIG